MMEGPGLRGKETEVVGAESGRGRLIQSSPAIGCHGPWLPRTLAATDL